MQVTHEWNTSKLCEKFLLSLLRNLFEESGYKIFYTLLDHFFFFFRYWTILIALLILYNYIFHILHGNMKILFFSKININCHRMKNTLNNFLHNWNWRLKSSLHNEPSKLAVRFFFHFFFSRCCSEQRVLVLFIPMTNNPHSPLSKKHTWNSMNKVIIFAGNFQHSTRNIWNYFGWFFKPWTFSGYY